MGPHHCDVVVVGGGHAGAEAAWAAAGAGASVTLVTLDPARIGVMSCNPAIGGLAKGQIVREVDALGGLMGLAADASGINFKVLNASRGPAVRGPRVQCDKHAYAEAVQSLLAQRRNISVVAGAVLNISVDARGLNGVVVQPRGGGGPARIHARAVVLTTGTFMRGLMHRGETQTPGGRCGEAATSDISEALRGLGFELARLKTGTPPRLRRGSIDWESLDRQDGDDPPQAFSDRTAAGLNPAGAGFPSLEQVECRVTSTDAAAHEIIRENLHRAPMYNGQVESAGPRYCPSIEDKVVRFAGRESHHVFLEPESHRDDSIYCNGISTSLPEDVQREIVGRMPGCAHAEILRYGYAVEYDMSPPHQIEATCMTKLVDGFFLAGQINGTTGYEEAAGQGLLAGLNAARYAGGESLVTLGREEAYIGVMMDDLVTKTPTEPYRMFTSRAEHRLLLRADNAADRLTEKGRGWGLIDDAQWRLFQTRREEMRRIGGRIDRTRVADEPLSKALRRPGFDVDDLAAALGGEWSRGALLTALTDRQYAGYVERQRAEIRRHREMERRRIPADLDYTAVSGLRSEAREALTRFRPSTVGQASRLEGVNPADISLILVAMRRRAGSTGVAAA